MKGYKHTELGWIPEDWNYMQFADIADVIMGQSPDGSTYNQEGNGIPLLNGPTEFTEKHPVKIQWTSAPTKICAVNDILLCVRGSSTGRINIANDKYCIGRGIAAIRAKEDNDHLFVEYQLSNAVDKILSLTTGSTFPNIDSNSLKSIIILTPPYVEQRRIGQLLSTWDKSIETLTQLIAAKQELKKALMQQLLTGKKRLPGFKGKWINVKIGDIMEEIIRKMEWDDNDIYDLISVRRRSGGVFYRQTLPGSKIKVKDLRPAVKGDFLISKMQAVHGACGLVTGEFDGMKISSSYIALIPKATNKVIPEFFNYLSRFPEFYHLILLSSHGVHIEKMTFELKEFLKKKVRIPEDIKEQQEITKFLSSQENEINCLSKQLDSYKEQKQGLMQQLLTGKKRVKV